MLCMCLAWGPGEMCYGFASRPQMMQPGNTTVRLLRVAEAGSVVMVGAAGWCGPQVSDSSAAWSTGNRWLVLGSLRKAGEVALLSEREWHLFGGQVKH